MTRSISRRTIHILTITGLLCTVAFCIYGFHIGLFQDQVVLTDFVDHAGWLGILLFIIIQIVQVVIPIIPGGISCMAGVLLYGVWWGFLYNYIGIVIGSFINFFLARYYGKPFIQSFVSEKTYHKYMGWLDNEKRFARLFTLAIIFPVAPDDFLCMVAGISNLSLKRFSAVIVFGKPASIFLYSLALLAAQEWLVGLLG